MNQALKTSMGRYRVIAAIGDGGTSSVWEALHQETHEHVALKRLKPTFCADREMQRRFVREFEVSKRLSHRNILRVLELFYDGDVPVLAIAFIEGGDGSVLLDQVGHVPERVALLIVRQVATALVAAHRAGVVHRDIKPSNLLISHVGVVKLSDFGIALDLDSEEDTAIYGIGTPSYMSPEQVRGDPLDGRSDVFSLSVVLYELLSGKNPFSQSETHSVMRAIEESEAAALGAHLSDSLQELVAYGLKKSVAKRCPDMQTFKSILDRELGGGGEQADFDRELAAYLRDRILPT